MADIESRITREKLYEGLNVNHTPRLFVPEQFIERRSGRLQRLAAQALLDSHMFPDTQFDVVWLGSKPSVILSATMQPTGTYGHSFGQPVGDEGDHFLVDPSWIEQGMAHFNYADRIEKALENGAGVFRPADLAPRK